jgi:hypothetical protein
MNLSYDQLVSVFRRLGAPDPESWAQSEIEEGIPQLLRYLVLRNMWSCVVADGDTRWIDTWVKGQDRDPNAPLAGVRAALRRLLASGADPRDITEVVRGMQYETLFGIAYRLDGPWPELDEGPNPIPELKDVSWALFEVDSEGHPIRSIEALHESALDTDPTGREMRPAGRSAP